MANKNTIKWAFAALSLLKVISAAAAKIIDYVKSTEGAIGYIDEVELKAGMNVVGRK